MGHGWDKGCGRGCGQCCVVSGCGRGCGQCCVVGGCGRCGQGSHIHAPCFEGSPKWQPFLVWGTREAGRNRGA